MHADRWTMAALVGALAVASVARAQPAAAAQRYHLGAYATVTLPVAAAQYTGPAGLFVSATAQSLAAALEAAGWQHAAHPPVAGASWSFCRGPQHSVGAAAGDRVLAWNVGPNLDGPGEVYFVRLVHDARAAHPTDGRLDAGVSLNAIFLTGTSRLGLARPARVDARPLAWVRLRHAAGELRLAPAAGEATANAEVQQAACSPSGVSRPEEGALQGGDGADRSSAQGHEPSVQLTACIEPPAPNAPPAPVRSPAAGPRCETHAALPLHPLSADKIASSVVWHNASERRQVALTFDACSTFAIGRFNARVVAALRALHVPATLFVGGHWAEMYPDVLEALAQDPLFEIGNHTYSHPHMRDLTVEAQRQELLWTQELIFERTGKVPRLFRPPYGEVDDALITTAAKNGLYTVEYDLPAGDADDHVTTARLTGWVVGRSTPGSIVVMHMCRPNNHTAEALYKIVPRLRAQGYTFCQVGDMLFNEGKGCR